MIVRHTVQCATCGARTITRTALVDTPYLEFAFPCPGCTIEIRFAIALAAPKFEYVKLDNGAWLDSEEGATNVEVFDPEHLIPVPKSPDISPFIATTSMLPASRLPLFYEHQGMRRAAVELFWPQLERLHTHFRLSQFDLFDRQYQSVQRATPAFVGARDRGSALHEALTEYGQLFREPNEKPYRKVRARLKAASASPKGAIADLLDWYSKKDSFASISDQLCDIRRRWATIYYALAPIHTSFYWEPREHHLASYTLSQKRFDDLKSLFVDSFEILCRISVIAALVEGLISAKTAVVTTRKGALTPEEFASMSNGSKPDVLKNLPVANMFVPYIDHSLWNGIGHHTARYVAASDTITYTTDTPKGQSTQNVPYIVFCQAVVELYGQLELVSLYANWLDLQALAA